MDRQPKLPINLRQKAYVFSLFVYETFEALPERGILVQDIESGVNRLLAKIASYETAEIRGKLIKDIISELRGIKVLLGIVRDISLIERYRAGELFSKVTDLESILVDLFTSTGELAQPVGSNKNASSSADTVALSLTAGEYASGDREKSGGPAADTKPVTAGETDNPQNDTNQVIVDAEEAAEPQTGSSMGANISPVDTGMPKILISNIGAPVDFVASARQEAVMEVLKRRDRVSVGELAKLFSGRVSAKTLQRDLQDLIEKGRVLRHGVRRWTVYSLSGV